MRKAFLEYIQSVTGNRSTRSIASKTGMTHTTLASHLSADVPNIETVLNVVRVFDLPLIPTFIAAGYMTEHEVREFLRPTSLRQFSDLELSEEILRRATERTMSDRQEESTSAATRGSGTESSFAYSGTTATKHLVQERRKTQSTGRFRDDGQSLGDHFG